MKSSPVKRSGFRRLWGAGLVLIVTSAHAAIYDFSLGDPGIRQLRLNIPDGLAVVRGIVIFCNGAGGDVRSGATDPELVGLAESMGFAVMGTSHWSYFPQGYNPSEYSGWQYALEQLAALTRHPELVRAPWIPYGMSNGGQMSYGLNALAPEKSIGMAINKAPFVTIALPDYAALHTPGLILAGELDYPDYISGVHDIYFNNRPRGALWAWAEEEMMAHHTGDSYELILPFMAEVCAMRYPAVVFQYFGVYLNPVSESSGWLTDPDSYKNGLADIAPYAAYAKDKTIAGWLPNRRLAYIFRAYASYHKATREATLSSGTGPVAWDTTITYTIGEPAAPWTAVDFYEGDIFLKRVTPADGAGLSVAATASAPGYSVFHALVTLADGTQRTTMPRRVFVRAGLPPQAPSVRALAASAAASPGDTAMFSPSVAGYPTPRLQWWRNGVSVPGATAATLVLPDVQPADAGVYTLTAANSTGSVTGDPAIVGLLTTSKVTGAGQELQPADMVHPNGNIFDQVLLNGAAETVTADANQITRTSYVDLNNDIVQVEFSGAGTLSLVLDNPAAPAAPANYHQPGVSYVKGHAGIVIVGANETTNLSIFTVGRATAFDPTGAFDILQPASATNIPANNGSPLFQGHEATVYDGVADIAFIAIASANGKFGGLRAADANCFATKGLTGIYAPGVRFDGPVFAGNINASDAATPVFVIGASPDTRITGGDLLQSNGQPVRVGGLTQLKFTAGTNAQGATLTAQANKAVLQENGVDVTASIVVNPGP